MSGTPRCDNASWYGICEGTNAAVTVEFARKLERELATVTAERRALAQVLEREGFRECDIPICNCGSWHHVGGLAERWREITTALKDAGVLDNSTGNVPLRAIEKLAAERDAALTIIRSFVDFEDGRDAIRHIPQSEQPAAIDARHQLRRTVFAAARAALLSKEPT